MTDKTRLKNKLIAAFAEEAEETDADAAIARICDKMAEAIVDEIKELKVTYTNGLVAGSTAVTGVLNHTNS